MKKEKRGYFLRIIVVAIVFLAVIGTAVSAFYFSRNENRYQTAIKAGAEWFVNNQNEDFLYYEYVPVVKKHMMANQRLREMGAMWSIAKAYHFLDDVRYKNLAEKGFAFFEKSFKYDAGQDISFANITPQRIKLGYNAFVILTLLEIGNPKADYYFEKFANGIAFQQNDDGSFNTFFYSSRNTGVDYYPGEAMFALMSLYEKTKNRELLQEVEKAFPYYQDYWRKNKNTGFVPWQSRAYRKLAVATGKKEVSDFLFEMNDWLLDQHSPKECKNFDFSRGITTSVFIEGVIQAYLQAKDMGDKEREECYANFIKEGSDYVLTLQITDTDDMYAYGGFLGNEKTLELVQKNDTEAIEQKISEGEKNSSKKQNFMRVDNNQHAITALIEAYELGLLRD